MIKKNWIRSENFGARKNGLWPQWIVLHHTAMSSCGAAIERLCDQSAEVSTHYIIDEDATLVQMVDEHARAWHAGQSFWRGEKDMNSWSIGIELQHTGEVTRAYQHAQIETLITLCHNICERWAIPKTNILGHSDIAISRKTDPGANFPWERLAEQGLGVSIPASCGTGKEAILNQTEGKELQHLLSEIGYAQASAIGQPLLPSQRTMAFKMHYERHVHATPPTRETMTRAKAVMEQLNKMNRR